MRLLRQRMWASRILTGITHFHTVNTGMRTRFISLVVLLVVAGSAFAGAPLHSNEQSCGMGGAMGAMDCCKAALSHNNTPQVASARLCCSLNCSQNGTTSSNGVRVQLKVQPSLSAHLTGSRVILPPVLFLRHSKHSHSPPTDSQPAYIRHLALLI
jgi:hypothetical protein